MVLIKLNELKRKIIKEINALESEVLPYDVVKFISGSFNISITEVMEAHQDGRMLVTKNKKLFASFLFEEWMSAMGISKDEDSTQDNFIKIVWYDFTFVYDYEHVLRYSESELGINDNTLLHIFYEGKGDEE
ncbi:hypothetical protein [Lactococcus phage P1048]|uniref:Uncharacterized protein n=1 Tax=Lactococcus phage P1048 TaxID=2662295 RepID=A0A649V3F6_9CAUD|nr:hypothetical protein H1Z36_gp044 [Lactococcus phage P1048]QGJ84925.1 hypothetical protein [Lactococcus phage P1048]